MIVACCFGEGLLDVTECLWGLYSFTGFLNLTRPSRVSGGQSPSSYGGGPGSLLAGLCVIYGRRSGTGTKLPSCT